MPDQTTKYLNQPVFETLDQARAYILEARMKGWHCEEPRLAYRQDGSNFWYVMATKIGQRKAR